MKSDCLMLSVALISKLWLLLANVFKFANDYDAHSEKFHYCTC